MIKGGISLALIAGFGFMLTANPVFAKKDKIELELSKSGKQQLVKLGKKTSDKPGALLFDSAPSEALLVTITNESLIFPNSIAQTDALQTTTQQNQTQKPDQTNKIASKTAVQTKTAITEQSADQSALTTQQTNITPGITTVLGGSAVTVTAVNDSTVSIAVDPGQLNGLTTNLNASNLAAGTVPDARLSAAVSLLGQTIEPSEILGTIPYSKLSLASSIANADIAVSAAISYSKLNLAGAISNNDIAPNAAIHYSKLDLTGLTVPATIADGSVTDAKLASSYAKLDSSFTRGDKLYSGVFSFDSSYPTGGETVDLTGTFATAIRAVIVTSSKDSYTFEVDETLFSSRKFKLKAIKDNGNEVNNSSNLSSITNVRYLAIGQ